MQKEFELRQEDFCQEKYQIVSWCKDYREDSNCNCSYAKQRRQIKDSSKLQKILSGGEV